MKRCRTVFILALAGICLLLAGCVNNPAVSTDEADLAVMTFNIRYGWADDGQDSWKFRKDLVMNVIRDQSPDLVGLQEALQFQLDAILGNCPEYRSVGIGRDPGGTGEYAAILYRAERFEPMDSGTFWMSDTPEVPSASWGNRYLRICTWVRLKDRLTGTYLYHYNTHFDHESQPSRENSALLLAQRIARRDHPDPVIVTGDFNAGESNSAIEYLLGMDASIGSAPVQLVDSFRMLHPDETKVGTFNYYRGETAGDKIDYVFVEPGTRVLEAAIVRDNREGRYPSDHYPVTARIRFEKQP